MSLRPKTAFEHGIMEGFPPPKDKRVTIDNWDRHPFNRWSFLNVREILPTVQVSADNHVNHKFSEQNRMFDELSVSHPRDGREETLHSFLESTYTDGFIVLSKDQIIFERYYNSMTRKTLHLSQSVAKSITGAVCGILIHRGQMDRDMKVGHVIPELKDKGYGDASLGDLLDMQSGIKFDENYTDEKSDIAMIDRASLWKPLNASDPQAILDIPALLDKSRDHGSYFEYRSIETEVMAWMMQRCTGQSLAKLVSNQLWVPMGAEQSASFTVDRSGHPLADGGFNACLRDYARIGLLYLNKGKICDKQILPEEWVRQTRQDGDVHAFKNHQYAKLFPRGAYKNQFWVRDVDKEQIMARGVFGQMIYIDPTSDMVIVKMSTWPDFINIDFLLDTLDAADSIARML